jgi:hypothetical protein
VELRQEGLVEACTELYVEGDEGIRTVPLTIAGVGRLVRRPTDEKLYR